MSEEDLRIQQIKMKIKGLTFEQARDISNLCSEYYIEGLEQSRFDKRMLEVELSGYRQAILQDKELMGLKEDKDRLQQENKQLKQELKKYRYALKVLEDTKLYKEIFEMSGVVQERDLYKEVIKEVREYMKKHPCDTWYYSKKKSDKFLDIEIIRCDEELLQILDKAKENK